MAASKKKAPKEPKPAKPAPEPPTNVVQELFRGLVGRGIRPLSLWFACVFLPLSLLLSYHDFPLGAYCFILLWTMPLERVAYFTLGVGNLRECLADVVPYIPGLLPYLPGMLKVVLPNLLVIAPAVGPLAPYLKYLVPRPAFLARALPLLVPRMSLMLKYNMIEMLGPQFARMTDEHYDKLELILEPLMRDLDILAPHFHVIAPYIVEISLRADVLFPVVQLLLPHIEECEPHLWWLIPFADVPGFQEFLTYLDVLVPSIDEFAIYGPDLMPFIPKIRAQIPILVENLDALLPMMGAAVDHMDPLVYYLSAYMPVANKLGLLNKSALLSMALPLLSALPNVPERERTFVPPKQELLVISEVMQIPLVRKCKHSGVYYYVLARNGQYVGELRYSTLRALNEKVVKRLLPGETWPSRFPDKQGWFAQGEDRDAFLETRRLALERFLQQVLREGTVTQSAEYKKFVQNHMPVHLHPVLL